ncbi:MAG: phosphatidate cytidylyltransferase [Kiritimatiellae bacterium]|nr:phosphatidate cytidylyltransferase [Kiritimatiellia bacterium]
MIALFSGWHYLLLLLLYVAPGVQFLRRGDTGALVFMGTALGALLVFSVVCRIVVLKKVPGYQEVVDRTKTWYWMLGVFFLTMAFHRGISFAALGFLSFSALREYFSLLPMYSEEGGRTLLRRYDKSAILLSYISVPLMFYLAYVKWYNLYIILVPVYVALLIPALLVFANKSENYITSTGVILYGTIVFVFLFGHSAFLVNLHPLVLFFGIFLTELRDVAAYSIGKLMAPIMEKNQGKAWVRLYDLRIASEISPKKNLGTSILSTVVIMLIALAYRPIMPAFPLGRMSVPVALLLGFLVSLMGLVGDLVSSAMKRDLGVKDSGSILPGHGGVIDRIDSLCFTLPVVFHVCYYLYFMPFTQRGL